MEATSFRVHCFGHISRSIGWILERRHSLKIPFHDASNDITLFGVKAFGGSGRGLECVGCGDLIVVRVLDIIAFVVASN
jgi:hypothetical protein